MLKFMRCAPRKGWLSADSRKIPHSDPTSKDFSSTELFSEALIREPADGDGVHLELRWTSIK